VPALINGSLTAVVFAVSRRTFLVGVLSILVIPLACVAVLWFWPSPAGPSRHSRLTLFEMYSAIVAFTWFPGALLALIAGRIGGRGRPVLGTVSICVGLIFGAAFILTALGFACGFLGDCL
jgi:hypothetical protein